MRRDLALKAVTRAARAHLLIPQPAPKRVAEISRALRELAKPQSMEVFDYEFAVRSLLGNPAAHGLTPKLVRTLKRLRGFLRALP